MTFQVIFVSDGQLSYTFYHYKPNQMKLSGRRQFIGLLVDGEAIGLEDSSDGSLLNKADENIQYQTSESEFK